MFPVMQASEFDPLRSGITRFNPLAGPLFERARGRGNRSRLIARLLRRSWRPLLLSDALSPDMIHEAPPAAIQLVDLDAIRGSINRCEEFDRHFYPLTERLGNRWVRIASMMLQDSALPPVDLVRVRHIYFVVDGHHRISVARMLGHATVDAIITAAYS